MADERTIAQRELRNDVGRVLREAEAGTTFTITVRGRPVAKLGPTGDAPRRVDVPHEELREMMRDTPVHDEWLEELLELRRSAPPAKIPWED